MNIDDIFKQRKKRWDSLKSYRKNGKIESVECPDCHKVIDSERLRREAWICPECRHYFAVPAADRIEMVCDQNSFREMYPGLTSVDPLNFPGYPEKLAVNQEKSGLMEAFVCGTGKIHSMKVAIGVLDGRFLMGSMGSVVGEKICRLTEYAAKKRYPLIIFSASGGARMQEGLFSLMQMANTSASVKRFQEAGGLFLSCLTNPTTGGVSASYASLGDIILAEPDALICFAGPRVIQQTIGQTLPEGFQHAEFLLEHGMIDRIVPREEMKETLSRLLMLHLR